MSVVCCICAFALKREPADAETIINGYAVCAPHAYIAMTAVDWPEMRDLARQIEAPR